MKTIPHLIEAKRFGMTESEAIREISSCAHRILESDVFEVEDARIDHLDAGETRV